MLRKWYILTKVVGCATLLLFGAAVFFVPLSADQLLRVHREQAVNMERIHSEINDPLAPVFQGAKLEAVKRYASLYGMDFRLILAIIKQESQFRERAISERGAKGYMQIMPVTNSELREELDLSEPELPIENLRTGIYYFSKLYSLFPASGHRDRLCLALAAYNAGPARVYDAQEVAAYIGEDARNWNSVKSSLPLLSKRYYSLHQTIWEGGRPPTGYFGESRQTIDYVRGVLKTYAVYQSAM